MANEPCTNCGDGSGWVVWRFTDRPDEWVWAACADCNDDEHKPKPKPPTCPT